MLRRMTRREIALARIVSRELRKERSSVAHQGNLFPDNQFRDAPTLREFMLAGKAKITVRSEKTLKHFTYKIRKDKDSEKRFVHRLVADNNYVYIGTVFEDGHFNWTKRSAHHRSSDAYKGFEWLWSRVGQGILPRDVTVFHEGRCGMCGLELTDPISIKEGYGPDCRKKRLRHSAIQDSNKS